MLLNPRYAGGLKDFGSLYRPLATTWRVYDNYGDVPRPIAAGFGAVDEVVVDDVAWRVIKESVS